MVGIKNRYLKSYPKYCRGFKEIVQGLCTQGTHILAQITRQTMKN